LVQRQQRSINTTLLVPWSVAPGFCISRLWRFTLASPETVDDEPYLNLAIEIQPDYLVSRENGEQHSEIQLRKFWNLSMDKNLFK
jgi:hypothetical protein